MRRILVVLLSIAIFSSTFTACSRKESVVTRNESYDTSKISGDIVNANSGFAFDIFKKLNAEDSDISTFISPISMSTALTMVYNGAESTTKGAMSKTLKYNNIDKNIVNESYSNLLNYLENVDKKVELDIANSIWIRDGGKIKEDFLLNNKNSFNAKIDNLDFSKDSAADTINKWISKATKNKIDKMIEPPIDSRVIMYLINAIYFKGEWDKKFDPEDTCDCAFKAFDGKEQTVKMMSRQGKVEYKKGDGYKVVRLPYGSGKTSMYCVLPDEGTNINQFIENMSIQRWNDIRKNISKADEVVLQIPKFKLEYGIKNLNNSLQLLGMGQAFSEQADFSGIEDNIFISKVIHKAVIEVNEEGSEAAGSTVVEMKEQAAFEPTTFIADRPFMFIISDDTTGTILFMGKLLSVG